MTTSPDVACVHCCIEAPADYIPKARYALRMLFNAYRVDIEWVTASHLSSGDVYYGTQPEHAPDGVFVVGLALETIRFFEKSDPRPPEHSVVTIGSVDVPALFPCVTGNPGGGGKPGGREVAFDLIASSFFMLSGWQEIHMKQRDDHGRVRFDDSIQALLGSPDIPYVDVYRVYLQHMLKRVGRILEQRTWDGHFWAFCPTHDIDYVRKWRPGIIRRELLHRAVLNREDESVFRRVRRVRKTCYGVLSGNDPFKEAISRIRAEILSRNGTGTFFFKTAARAPHDVRFAPNSPFLQQQYVELRRDGFEIALHPSYHAYNYPDYLRDEKNVLALASGVHASTVRSHYLRFDPVLTPRVFCEAGFTIDSTLGWATQVGFRHGTCHPFQLYDHTSNRSLDTWEMPLIVMESTLFNRKRLHLEEAVEQTLSLMETCKRYGGVFVGLWHNTLWDEEEFPGWGAHFTTVLDAARSEEGSIASLSGTFQSWK